MVEALILASHPIVPTEYYHKPREYINGEKTVPKWGTIVIVGGSGRLGYYISQELMRQPECGRVVSISRRSKIAHYCAGFEYLVADITDKEALEYTLRDVVPKTIINSAAPAHTDTQTPSVVFKQVFVHAQDMLMRLAQQIGTRYMICKTSSSVIEGYHHIRVNETAPLWSDTASAFPYWVQRARAEKRLLAFDLAVLQTVSLRLPLIIGEREDAFVPAMLKTLEDGQARAKRTWRRPSGHVSGTDAARAHMLELRALRIPNNNVHGEAFYITGKTDLSFWTMARIIWSETGWKQDKSPFILPGWLVTCMAFLSELVMRPFGGEPALTRHMLRFMCNTWTYDDSKAEARLGYTPE